MCRVTRSTLFPYTTLFRSKAATSTDGDPTDAIQGVLDLQTNDAINYINGNIATSVTQAARSAMNSEDRKSTRLNSSHVAISYAVFCLKKKNIWIMKSLYSI